MPNNRRPGRGRIRLSGLLSLVAVVLTGCGRPLTGTEAAFAAQIHGDTLNASRVRLVDGALVGEITFVRKPRPRLTCRERLLPPAKEELVTVRPAAVTLFNRIFFSKDWYLDDYAPGYPDRLHIVEAMLLAHELTHVWQWQNRKLTGYHPLKAAVEHQQSDDPYLFDFSTPRNFLSYGYEQQGTIVEEYVCCRSLAPKAARTKRLHEMLSAVFDVAPLPESGRERDVYLPWKGAKIGGICD
ncbi:MAG: hypothetical protein ACWA5A_01380 [Marinibacterium sp.]